MRRWQQRRPPPPGGYQIRVTAKAARASAFDTMSTRYTAPESRAVVPTSVASFGGRITIAAQRRELPFYPTPAWGPAVLLTGSSPSNVGGMTDIPGSRATDSPPMLYARSKTEVLVGWNHVGFSTNEQGIWTAWALTAGAGCT